MNGLIRNVMFPTSGAIDELMKKTRCHNSDNVFFIDRATGQIRGSVYEGKNAHYENTPIGCYSIVISSDKVTVTRSQLTDAIKGQIDAVVEYGVQSED